MSGVRSIVEIVQTTTIKQVRKAANHMDAPINTKGGLGVDVVLASNGKEGQELALSDDAVDAPYDFILMNMAMPVMDGYTATRKLREAGYDRPIIAVTSDPVRQKCLDAGCTDYLQKPISFDSLDSLLRRYGKN
jgi:CheY-like chemotaxis protein